MKISIISFGCSEASKYLYNKIKESNVEIEYCFAIEQSKEKLEQVLPLAEDKSDVIFYVGGLGYSQNDILKEFLAQKYNVDMVIQQKSCDLFANYINQSKNSIPPEHVQQRLFAFPDGFDCYQNQYCYELSANGRFGGKEIFLLPDNLQECQYVFSTYIANYLSRQTEKPKSFVYKAFGLSKSEVEDKLFSICKNDCKFLVETDIANDSKIVILFDSKMSQSVVDKINTAILKDFAEALYAVDDFSLSQVAVDLLKLYKRQLSVAESLTGGCIVSSIIDVPGASEVLFSRRWRDG